ncbi:MAG: hypothetical protein AUI58_05620 [Chloroflexi bacterium 13_1_40CM_2_70_6]|nr:MAG: hypothetical protein AUI58_05620 [Chloroflexi bacterium 13_1_40CM_2_70_6]OLE77201.1 MAG: hypothetical protein AUG02_02550 [Chloroflexi bacterium 13_1_20CM_2_70_9]
MCVFTDVSEMPASAAITFVVLPAATARRISSWRPESTSCGPGRRTRMRRDSPKPRRAPTAKASAARPFTLS